MGLPRSVGEPSHLATRRVAPVSLHLGVLNGIPCTTKDRGDHYHTGQPPEPDPTLLKGRVDGLDVHHLHVDHPEPERIADLQLRALFKPWK